MRNIVKTLTIVISAIMILGSIAGCSQKENTAASSAQSRSATEPLKQEKEAGESQKPEGGTDWPTKTIEIVVPGGAGGDTDLCTRMLAEKLQDELGQPIIITNIGGSGGSIGAREVVEAEPT